MPFFNFRQPEDIGVPVMDNNQLLRYMVALLNGSGSPGAGGSSGVPAAGGGSGVGESFVTVPDLIVDTAGIRKQSAGVASPRGVVVTAHPDNSGYVYVGGSTVTNKSGNACGIPLVAGGMSIRLQVSNTNLIYGQVDSGGENNRICIQVL